MPQSWIAPQQNSLMDTFAQAEQLKAQRAQNAFNEAKIAELPYERERAEALNAAKISKAEAEGQGADLANTLKRVELGAQILSGVRDEGSYQWARKRAVSIGLPVDHLPESYDPAFVERTLQSGMKIRDQLTQQLNERKFSLDVADTQSKIGRREVQNRYSESMMGKPMVVQTPGGAFTYDPANPQQVTRMDTGPSQAELAAEKEATRQYERANPVPAPLSAKDRTMAKLKMTNISLAKQQLAAVRDAYDKMGLAGQYNPASESGRLFERTVDALRSTISGLTRTPGVGAMSDYETRLDQAKMPTRLDYPGVTKQQIQSLDDMVNTLEAGYSDLTGPPPQQAPNTPRAPVTMAPPVMEPGADPGGTREQFIEEARRRGLVP